MTRASKRLAVYWRMPGAVLPIVRELLAAGGSLSEQGFMADDVLIGDVPPSPAVCVRARPA